MPSNPRHDQASARAFHLFTPPKAVRLPAMHRPNPSADGNPPPDVRQARRIGDQATHRRELSNP
jgi:hypothetical protein